MRKFPKAEIQKRVQDAAEILGIQELLKRKPRQLSGGQRQRVAVGRAIVRHPQVFLFDEPLSNLDAKLRVQMRVELKRLHERLETTAIYVTHDQVEAMTLGSRVVVMKDGWVQQVGEPLEIYSQPLNRFVAGFIGSPSMNFIPVTLTDGSGTLFAEASGLKIKVPPQKAQSLMPYKGQGVTLGLARPLLRGRGRGGGAAGRRDSAGHQGGGAADRGPRGAHRQDAVAREGAAHVCPRSDPLLRRQDGAGDQVSSRLTVMRLTERAPRGVLGRGLPALLPMP